MRVMTIMIPAAIYKKLKFEWIRLRQRKFLLSVLAYSSGTTIGEIIGILAAPFITRLYGPEAFGLLSVFNSIVNIIGPVAALTLPMAIVIAKDDQEAFSLSKASFNVSVVVALLVLIGFNFPAVIRALNIEELGSYMFLIPIVVVSSVGTQINTHWLIRKDSFFWLSIAAIIIALLTNISKVALGVQYQTAFTLILITTLGYFLGALIQLVIVINNQGFSEVKLLARQNKKSTLDTLSEYREYITYRAPKRLLDAVTMSIPIIILTAFIGPASVAYYALGKKVLMVPSKLIGYSTSEVYFSRASKLYNAGRLKELRHLHFKTIKSLGLLGLFPYFSVFLIGPYVFGFIFGEGWELAGDYARWLSLWSYLTFLQRPSLKTLLVLSEYKLELVYSILSILLKSIALIIGVMIFNDGLAAIILFSLTGTFMGVFIVAVTFRKLKNIR
jgi:O-antigen/teichoic acid export membrane protein